MDLASNPATRTELEILRQRLTQLIGKVKLRPVDCEISSELRTAEAALKSIEELIESTERATRPHKRPLVT